MKHIQYICFLHASVGTGHHASQIIEANTRKHFFIVSFLLFSLHFLQLYWFIVNTDIAHLTATASNTFSLTSIFCLSQPDVNFNISTCRQTVTIVCSVLSLKPSSEPFWIFSVAYSPTILQLHFPQIGWKCKKKKKMCQKK